MCAFRHVDFNREYRSLRQPAQPNVPLDLITMLACLVGIVLVMSVVRGCANWWVML